MGENPQWEGVLNLKSLDEMQTIEVRYTVAVWLTFIPSAGCDSLLTRNLTHFCAQLGHFFPEVCQHNVDRQTLCLFF